MNTNTARRQYRRTRTPLDTNHARATFALRMAQQNTHLRALTLTAPQARMMAALTDHLTNPQRWNAPRLTDAMFSKLEAAGLVRHAPADSDPRRVALTDLGTAYARRADTVKAAR